MILVYRVAKKRGRPVPIQSGSLIGWLARTTGFFYGEVVMHALVTISHQDP